MSQKFTYPGSTHVVAGDGESIGFSPSFSVEGAAVRDPSRWASRVISRNDVLRTDERLGAFGEVNIENTDKFLRFNGDLFFVDIEEMNRVPGVECRHGPCGSG